MNHEIPFVCPRCGHEYDAHLHWFQCPMCGHDSTWEREKMSLERKRQLPSLQHKTDAI